jgi:hypothetical protein
MTGVGTKLPLLRNARRLLLGSQPKFTALQQGVTPIVQPPSDGDADSFG